MARGRGWDSLKSWCYYFRYPLLMGLAIIADRLFILWPYFDGRYRSLAMKQACLEVYYETLWWLSHVLSTTVVVLLFLVFLFSSIMALKHFWIYSEKKSWRAQIIQDVQGQTASIIDGVINEELAKVREIAKQLWGEIRSAKAEVTRDRNQIDQWRNDLKGREIAFNRTCQKLGLQVPKFEPEPELKVDPEPPAESNPPAVETPASDNQGDEAAANLECPVDPADLPQDDQASLPAANVPTDGQAAVPESESQVAEQQPQESEAKASPQPDEPESEEPGSNQAAGAQEPEVVAQPRPHEIITVTEDSSNGGVVVRLGHGGNGRFHEGIVVAHSKGGNEEKDDLDEDEETDPDTESTNIDNDEVVQAVVHFMEGRDMWEGRVVDLVPFLAKIDPKLEGAKPNVIAKKIYKVSDSLMTCGISLSHKHRSIRLKRLDVWSQK